MRPDDLSALAVAPPTHGPLSSHIEPMRKYLLHLFLTHDQKHISSL